MTESRRTPVPRDRDDAGRARNSRPRDSLGRPLPRWAAGVERVPDRLELPVPDALDLAQQHLTAARPFHAHEVLEALWKSRPADERDLWQGLAQLAVGLTHGLRGNDIGAVALLRRGVERLERYPGDRHGIAVDRVAASARALADHVDRYGIQDLRPADFVIRLR